MITFFFCVVQMYFLTLYAPCFYSGISMLKDSMKHGITKAFISNPFLVHVLAEAC